MCPTSTKSNPSGKEQSLLDQNSLEYIRMSALETHQWRNGDKAGKLVKRMFENLSGKKQPLSLPPAAGYREAKDQHAKTEVMDGSTPVTAVPSQTAELNKTLSLAAQMVSDLKNNEAKLAQKLEEQEKRHEEQMQTLRNQMVEMDRGLNDARCEVQQLRPKAERADRDRENLRKANRVITKQARKLAEERRKTVEDFFDMGEDALDIDWEDMRCKALKLDDIISQIEDELVDSGISIEAITNHANAADVGVGAQSGKQRETDMEWDELYIRMGMNCWNFWKSDDSLPEWRKCD